MTHKMNQVTIVIRCNLCREVITTHRPKPKTVRERNSLGMLVLRSHQRKECPNARKIL
jgi:hypothetical protein